MLPFISNDNDILQAAEHYQNEFVREDEAIRLLRKEIAVLDHLLVREVKEDGEPACNIINHRKRLSLEMSNIISIFTKLKFDFNNYLGDVL
ncbi:MAG: hypothetical protein JST17_03880 [Bacteroidetes bacterium]|nr:hypothetical protein [Bacteroidota bacterium]MBS1929548.1 hypothetical protein [Bacteroidota bacterium]